MNEWGGCLMWGKRGLSVIITGERERGSDIGCKIFGWGDGICDYYGRNRGVGRM